MAKPLSKLLMAAIAGLFISGVAALATLPTTVGLGSAQAAVSGPLDASLLGLGRSAT